MCMKIENKKRIMKCPASLDFWVMKSLKCTVNLTAAELISRW